MQSQRNNPKRWYKNKWIIFIVICFAIWLIPEIIFQIRYGGMPIASMTGGFAPDCVWASTAQAWIDIDRNGIRNQGDPPLPGVVFHVNDVLNQYVDVAGGMDPSDWKGETQLHVWLPGCPDANFEVYADTPAGYKAISDARPTVDVRDTDRTFSFGFTQLPNMATVTPRPPSPICESYHLGVANRYDITDIEVATDGSVWVATYNDGLRWLPPGQTEWVYIKSEDGLVHDQVRQITVTTNKVIWFATSGGASKFDGKAWTSFSTDDGLVDNNVYDIAVAPNGDIWFSTLAGISRYAPSTSTWTSLPFEIVSAVAIAPDGTPWISPFLENIVSIDSSSPKSLKLADDIELEDAEELVFAPDGTLWIAGFDGVARYSSSSGELVIFNSVTTNGVIGDSANDLSLSPDGTIWVAAGGYTPVIYHFIPSLEADPISAWRIYDTRDGLPSLPPSAANSDPVEAIAVLNSNEIWIATREHATLCYFED